MQMTPPVYAQPQKAQKAQKKSSSAAQGSSPAGHQYMVPQLQMQYQQQPQQQLHGVSPQYSPSPHQQYQPSGPQAQSMTQQYTSTGAHSPPVGSPILLEMQSGTPTSPGSDIHLQKV
jgi:hypothetical protein